MKIARIRLKNSVETYGIVSEDGKKIITKEQIQEKTGVPIPPRIKEFLFGGWLEEVNSVGANLTFDLPLNEVDLLLRMYPRLQQHFPFPPGAG